MEGGEVKVRGLLIKKCCIPNIFCTQHKGQEMPINTQINVICIFFHFLLTEDDDGLTVSMALKRPQPVDAFRARPMDIPQHQRSDRECLFIGQQA